MTRERRHALEAAAAGFVSAIVRRLPRRAVLAIGRVLGRIWAAFDGRHLRIAAENLRRAFPEWDEARVQATAHGVYRHFASVLLEILWMEGRPVADLSALTDVEGLEHMQAALARGRGVVSPIAHLGNWELQGVATVPLIGPSAMLAVITGFAAVPDCLAVLMSAAPNRRPMSEGLMGAASTQTTTSSGLGTGVGTLTSESSSSPFARTRERS